MDHQLSSELRIRRIHIRMMRSKSWVWLAPVALMGKLTVTQEEQLPDGRGSMTAYTDGINTTYGDKFVQSLSDPELAFLVVHENMHKAYRHVVLWHHLWLQNPYAAGAACDYVINQQIVDSIDETDQLKLEMPKCGGLLDPKFKNMNTAEVFAILMKNAKAQGKPFLGPNGKGGFDAHDFESGKAMSEEEQKQLARDIESALRQGQMLSKKMQGKMPREVGDLLEPAVDWRQALRDFFTTRTRSGEYGTYARPNRRYIQAGMYMPSTYQETPERIGFFIDTSGSIGDDMIRDALSEVVGACKVLQPEFMELMYWDTAVARHETYERADLDSVAHKTKPAGGGGTTPSCVVGYCREKNLKFDCVVWLSDGYVGSDWAEGLDAPAFWVITPGGEVPGHLPHVRLPENR